MLREAEHCVADSAVAKNADAERRHGRECDVCVAIARVPGLQIGIPMHANTGLMEQRGVLSLHVSRHQLDT